MQEYVVTIGGVEHTLQLSDEDAQRYPDAKPVQKSSGATTKARSADNK